jgi:hypothetical protein
MPNLTAFPAVLRIRDPALFWPKDPGSGIIFSGSRPISRHQIFSSFVTAFYKKKSYFLYFGDDSYVALYLFGTRIMIRFYAEFGSDQNELDLPAVNNFLLCFNLSLF